MRLAFAFRSAPAPLLPFQPGMRELPLPRFVRSNHRCWLTTYTAPANLTALGAAFRACSTTVWIVDSGSGSAKG